MSVYDKAHRLARSIRESDEYNEYQKIRSKVLNDEKAAKMLKDYQQQEINIQTKTLSGKEISEEEKKKLENLLKIIELNQDIKTYLEKEHRMNMLINDLQKILFADLEMGIYDFAEDEM